MTKNILIILEKLVVSVDEGVAGFKLMIHEV